MVFSHAFFSRNIGIDLGSANTLIYLHGKGIVLREPSVLALNKSGNIVAIGKTAEKMIGRTPEDIVIIKPVRDGVISNFHTTRIMLQHFFSRIFRRHSNILPLRAIVSIPLGITETEKHAVLGAVKQAGAKEVYLVENPIAGALGMNMPIEENAANMIVDLGEGTAEVAVISLGGIVSKNSLRLGSGKLNETIISFIRREFNFSIGERTAESIKLKVGLATPPLQHDRLEIMGNDLVTRLPHRLTLNYSDIGKLLSEQLSTIIKTIKRTLEEMPVSLISDILDNGIIITGGGALLNGFRNLLIRETKMPVFLAENCLDNVSLGTGKMLSSLPLLEKICHK
ncbi:MAG: rod shape-determining protein [Dethiobacteria bacterium]|jgi:rod shape-determining protein MreB